MCPPRVKCKAGDMLWSYDTVFFTLGLKMNIGVGTEIFCSQARIFQAEIEAIHKACDWVSKQNTTDNQALT